MNAWGFDLPYHARTQHHDKGDYVVGALSPISILPQTAPPTAHPDPSMVRQTQSGGLLMDVRPATSHSESHPSIFDDSTHLPASHGCRVTKESPMSMKNLHDVFVDLLKDTYHAEKQLVSALPKMAKASTSESLRSAFESHLKETKGHVERLEQAFEMIEMKPVGKVCHGMMGLVEEGKEVIEEKDGSDPSAIDAALIAAAQKVEHYEIVAYGTLTTFADTLGLTKVSALLKKSLAEEGKADQKLTSIAEGAVNREAAAAGSENGRVKTPTAAGAAKRR
jgi:ferritin-like metal-binding protein YciE